MAADTARPAGSSLPVCIAHRGDSVRAPENTLRAFAQALELGATWLELDVHHVHDRLLVIHDETVDRTTDGTGPLSAHSLAELRALDAGEGERIPFLEEVLELACGRARVNVELKGPGTAAPTVAVLQTAMRDGRCRPEQVVVSSFGWDRLAEVRRLAPDLPIAPLIGKGAGGEVIEVADRLGAEAIHISRWSARQRLVNAAHQRGLAVRVFTVNREWEYDLMLRLGVDGFFTDDPLRALTWGAQAPVLV
ncbi:glycerophosphodiester phosphodiesterase [bacterium]|nr:glycerophosphodiester phosphodiesterase [bacterium]